MTRRRVVVTGASGQLARAIVDVFAPDADLVPLPRADLDITDDRAVGARVREPYEVANLHRSGRPGPGSFPAGRARPSRGPGAAPRSGERAVHPVPPAGLTGGI